MNTVLFGFKSCGKTYLGTLLARHLQRSFVDTDMLIEKTFGMACRDIYKTLGEDVFRKVEEHAILSLQNISNAVIALGGGGALNSRIVLHLKKNSLFFFLKEEKEVLKKRVFSQSLPAFFDPKDPEKSFEELYEYRLPIYEAAADHIIDLGKKETETILREIAYGK